MDNTANVHSHVSTLFLVCWKEHSVVLDHDGFEQLWTSLVNLILDSVDVCFLC